MSTIKLHYIPSLDGMRALAVLAVVLYHLNPTWAPSGLLGVTMFFVLSGFLITSLLLVEYHNTETIDLPAFWMRRIKRLVPAIVFVILCTTALCALFNHPLLTKMRPDIIPSLLFFNNWWQIVHEVSYFEALGAPSPLTHFWSLAIEEQFYLIWPVCLLFLFKGKISNKIIRRGALIGAALSALTMALLFDPSADPSRVYYGTDTRAFSLLIGAWLAFVWPAWQLQLKSRKDFSQQLRLGVDIAGGVCLLTCLLIMFTINGFSPFLYRGGILLFSIITAALIAIIVHPASSLGIILSAKPLNWIGLRSYGIYLWHFPLLLLFNPPGTHPSPLIALVQVALIFAVAAFSYRFIESPIRKGKFQPIIKKLNESRNTLVRRLQYAPLAGCLVLIVVAGGGLFFVPDSSAVENTAELEQMQAEAEAAKAAAIAKAEAEARRFDVTLIGDSVSLAALPVFQETFPYGCLDSAVNRQFSEGIFVLNIYLEQDLIGKIVVLALGSNGPVDKSELEDAIAQLGPDRTIYLVTTRNGQAWEASVNDLYYRVAQEHPTVNVIDWYGLSQMQDNVFEGDNVHLTSSGAAYYNQLILDSVRNELPERSAKALEPTPSEPEASVATKNAETAPDSQNNESAAA